MYLKRENLMHSRPTDSRRAVNDQPRVAAVAAAPPFLPRATPRGQSTLDKHDIFEAPIIPPTPLDPIQALDVAFCAPDGFTASSFPFAATNNIWTISSPHRDAVCIFLPTPWRLTCQLGSLTPSASSEVRRLLSPAVPLSLSVAVAQVPISSIRSRSRSLDPSSNSSSPSHELFSDRRRR
jgi:hypothetical protein